MALEEAGHPDADPRSQSTSARPRPRWQPSCPSEEEEDPLATSPARASLASQRSRPAGPPSRQDTMPGKSHLVIYLPKSPSRHIAVKPLVKTSEPPPQALPDVAHRIGTLRAAPIRVDERQGAATTAPLPVVAARGRPKGWKPGMKYSVMRGSVPGAQRVKVKADGSRVVKRRGRPSKQPSPPPEAVYQELKPAFLAYLCEWSGCTAELHNLGTLRKHVHVVHGNGGRCLWGDCRNREPADEEDILQSEDLGTHMEEEHFVPMGWHVGDGPSNDRPVTLGSQVEHIPDYLRDYKGQQVTPSVRDQEVEDHATWRANRQKLQALIRRREENLPSDESDDVDDEQLF